MIPFTRHLCLAFLSLLSPLLWAQDSVYLSIDEAIEIALESNFSIRVAKNQAQAAQNNAHIGHAGMLPAIDLNARYDGSNNQYAIPNTEIENRASHKLTAGVQLNWTLFDGLKMFTTYRRYQELEQMGEVQARSSIERCVRQVIETYYRIVAAQQQLSSILQTLEVSRIRESHIRERHALGNASKLEVLNARVDFNSDSSQYLSLVETIRIQKVSLNTLLGRAGETEFVVHELIPFESGLSFETLLEEMLQQNSELSLARSELEIAHQLKREALSHNLPRIGVQVGYDFLQNAYNYGAIQHNHHYGFNYGVTASMNIFDGFNGMRIRRNARLELENAQIQLEEQTLHNSALLRQTYISYETALGMVTLETENLQTAEQNMLISLERYKLGSLTALELREAQRNYLNALNRHAQSLYLAKISETALKHLSGRLLSLLPNS